MGMINNPSKPKKPKGGNPWPRSISWKRLSSVPSVTKRPPSTFTAVQSAHTLPWCKSSPNWAYPNTAPSVGLSWQLLEFICALRAKAGILILYRCLTLRALLDQLPATERAPFFSFVFRMKAATWTYGISRFPHFLSHKSSSSFILSFTQHSALKTQHWGLMPSIFPKEADHE